MTAAVALDWRRPFATYADGSVPMYCAIVRIDGDQALTACSGSMDERDGYVSATSTTTDARRCRACLRACGEPVADDISMDAFGNLTSTTFTASFDGLPALIDHELERLQSKAAPVMPRTTAVDLPAFDVSDELTTGSGK